MRSSTAPAAALRPSVSSGRPVRSRRKSSSSALPGPVSQAINVVAVDIGDVGDAAEIEHRDRRLAAQLPDQSAMKDRRQRRALPAGGDVGGAKIINNRNAEPRRQGRPSPICTVSPRSGRCSKVWPWNPTAARLAGCRSLAARNVSTASACASFTSCSGLGDDIRPRRAIGQVRRGGGGAAQQRALGLGVRPAGGRAELRDPLAVGVDQGDIDAVLRGAAHQPDRQHRRDRWRPPTTAGPMSFARTSCS